MTEQQRRELIEAVRTACLKAARDAYDDAMMRGVCAEGALEAALGAIETLDPGTVVLRDARSRTDRPADETES